jgi:hypothetical protein
MDVRIVDKSVIPSLLEISFWRRNIAQGFFFIKGYTNIFLLLIMYIVNLSLS